ncbi:hypothetical protein ACE2AJ_18865 [Aquihabitans daechungensis]|uniref:hypothetical protein n=1 Tax=Aquihabitans daechungensis TaxID=1052257 RepID=UPI003B9F3ACF
MPDPAPAPAAPTATPRFLGIRATGDEFQMALWYPAWVPALWVALAGGGLALGFLWVRSDDAEASIFALGFGLICGFVAWFAARPLVTMDRSGIELRPSFGARSGFRWSEIASLGLDDVRRGRTRGAAFVVRGADDREAAVDGAWLGLTARELHRLDDAVRHFARSIGVTGPAAADAVLIEDEDARYH